MDKKESWTLLDVEEEGTHAKELALRARRQVIDLKDLVRFAEFLK